MIQVVLLGERIQDKSGNSEREVAREEIADIMVAAYQIRTQRVISPERIDPVGPLRAV
jgi:hypothetical protein